jgi:hypothetical protein
MAASLNETIQFLALLRRGTEVAEPGPVRDQIQDMVQLYEPLAEELGAIVRRLRARRQA